MDFSVYIGSIVKVNMKENDWYHYGKVLGADETFISLIDYKGKNITISTENIKDIREVEG